MQGKHPQEEKGGRWGGEAYFGSRLMGWMKERESVGRSEGGRRVVGFGAWAKGVALCVGRQEVGEGRGKACGGKRVVGGNKKRVK